MALSVGAVLTVVTVVLLRFDIKNKFKSSAKDDSTFTNINSKSVISDKVEKINEDFESSQSESDEQDGEIDIPSFSFRRVSVVKRNPEIHAFMERKKKCIKGQNPVEEPFTFPLILSGLTLALAHGGNDVGNAVGPFAAVLAVARDGEVAAAPDPPF